MLINKERNTKEEKDDKENELQATEEPETHNAKNEFLPKPMRAKEVSDEKEEFCGNERNYECEKKKKKRSNSSFGTSAWTVHRTSCGRELLQTYCVE